MTDLGQPLISASELEGLQRLVEADASAYLSDLEHLVNIDCGSYTKVGVDEVGRWMRGAFGELGAEVSAHPHERLGETVVAAFGPGSGSVSALLIGHMDTVFDPGTVAERPFRTDDEHAYGPGVTDMKSGLLAGLYALRALRAFGAGSTSWLPFERLVYVANPDEEIGSPSSSPIIRQLAPTVDVAFVLECARANGDIVSSRKGIVDVELRLTGRAAHAGVEPEKGRSAVLEAAAKTVALHGLNGRWPGVTVNVGVIEGGTRPNVVAERAMLKVDVRAVTRAGLEAAEGEVDAIAARTLAVPEVRCEVVERARHWPMEKLDRSDLLVDRARSIAERLGFPLHDAATGGASDANTTSGMGVATLDGLGPIGGNDHSPAEYLDLGSIGPRVTLLAALLLACSRDPEIGRWGDERRARIPV